MNQRGTPLCSRAGSKYQPGTIVQGENIKRVKHQYRLHANGLLIFNVTPLSVLSVPTGITFAGHSQDL